jgi:hypothetical protein
MTGPTALNSLLSYHLLFPAAYCFALRLRTLFPTTRLPHSESMYCSGLAGMLLLQAGSQVATVLVILVINSLLAYSSRLLTVFEKHHTRSSEARSLAWKLFMAQVGTSSRLLVC